MAESGLKGRVALVTGVSRRKGIGFAIANHTYSTMGNLEELTATEIDTQGSKATSTGRRKLEYHFTMFVAVAKRLQKHPKLPTLAQ